MKASRIRRWSLSYHQRPLDQTILRDVFYPLAKLRRGVKVQYNGVPGGVLRHINNLRTDDDPSSTTLYTPSVSSSRRCSTSWQRAKPPVDPTFVYKHAVFVRDRLQGSLHEWEPDFFSSDAECYIRKVMRYVTAIMEFPDVLEVVGVPADEIVRHECEVLVKGRLAEIDESQL